MAEHIPHGDQDRRLMQTLARLSRVTFVTASVIATFATVIALATITVMVILSI